MSKISLNKSIVLIVLALALAAGSACTSSGTWSGATTGEVVINVPPQKLFAYLVDPATNKEYDPGLISLDCKGEGIGASCTFKTKIFDEIYEGKAVGVEYVPNKKTSMVFEVNNGDVAFRGTTLYLPHPKGTRMVVVNEFYSFKLPALLSKLPHDMIQKKLQENMAENHQRIKAAAEKQ